MLVVIMLSACAGANTLPAEPPTEAEGLAQAEPVVLIGRPEAMKPLKAI